MSVSPDLLASVVAARAVEDDLDEYAERILEAADAQFREFGLRRTSLDRVAKAAGVSRITLFRRFANRDALIGAVVFRAGQRFVSEFDAAVPKEGPLEDRFAQGVVTAARMVSADPLLGRLMQTDPEDVLPHLSTHAEGFIALGRGYLVSVLASARADGLRISGDIEWLAEVFVRLVHSMMLARSDLLGDEERLAAFARTNLLPMLIGSGG